VKKGGRGGRGGGGGEEEEEDEEEEEMYHISCLYIVINFKLCANKERKVTNYEMLLSSPGSMCFSEEERLLNKKAKSELSRKEKKATVHCHGEGLFYLGHRLLLFVL
jgi:hypothetical protein